MTDERASVQDQLKLAYELAPDYATIKSLTEEVNRRCGIERPAPSWRRLLNERAGDLGKQIKARLRRPVVSRKQDDDDPFDVEAFFELSLSAAAEWKKRQPSRDQVSIQIETDAPIGLVFTSDWHVGGSGTEHLQIRTDNRLIGEYPLLYAYVGGDWANNFVLPVLAHAGASDVFSAGDQQYEIVLYLLRMLTETDSLLAIGDGNHDAWTQRLVNLDPRMHALKEVAHLWTGQGSMVHLTVGQQVYRIFRRHRHRWSSVFNPGHAVVAEYQRNSQDFDIGVIEHQHEPHFSGFHGKERPDGSTWRIAVRPGTYKVRDSYAQTHGYDHASSDLIVVVLHPHRFWMQPVRGLDNAIEYLDSVS